MAGRPSYGWKTFAAILVILAGSFNIIDGLIAITDKNSVAAGGNVDLPLTDKVNTWGWVIFIIGLIMVLAGFALISGSTWARTVVIIVASVNAIVQLAYMRHFPEASFLMVIVDLLVIYGVAVHGGREDEAIY